jgi:hypothetical protein
LKSPCAAFADGLLVGGGGVSGAWGMVGGECVRAMSGCRALGHFDAALAVGGQRDQRNARLDSADSLGLVSILGRYAPRTLTSPIGGL